LLAEHLVFHTVPCLAALPFDIWG